MQPSDRSDLQRSHCPVAYLEVLCPAVSRGKQSRFRAGYQGLAADSLQPVEERGATALVQMRGHLVQEHDWHHRRDVRHEVGMSEDEADQQRFLLARRRE